MGQCDILTINGKQVLCIQERSYSFAATRIQMVVSVLLGKRAQLVMTLHSGAAAWLQFTEQQKQSASDIVIL